MTRVRSTVLALLACVATAAAGWASRAALDEVVVGGVRQRIALVPSWPVFVAALALALLVATGLAAFALHLRRGRGEPVRVGAWMLPLFGLLALVVPYLPWAPDQWPVLQVLAGPGRGIVWLVVLAQFAWVLWPAVAPSTWLTRRSLRTQTIAIWLATAAASSFGAARLTHTVLFPSGDEPHYMVMAQSLWRDGDLKIQNNHKRGDYKEYFGRDLDPHFLIRGKDLEIYSIHPVGMPVLITPVFAAGGYDLVLAFFIFLAATAATVAWRWVGATTGAPGPTTLAWAAIVFSAPFLINSFTIYPETPAGLVATLAVILTLRTSADRRPWHDVSVSLLAGLLPWLSSKYAPMSGAILAVAWARVWWPLHAAERPDRSLASLPRLGGPYAVSVAGWFAFFYAYWGKPWPSAPYGSMLQTEVAYTLFGVPGLFFDQEYGLLAYAPAYVRAGFGLWTMARRPGALRRVALEVTLVVAALALTVGAFRIWWGGSAAPGRPMVSGLLLMMLPMAVQIGSAATVPARRAAQHLLIWLGVAFCLILMMAQEGLLVANGRDGTSSLLAWLSPRWPLWKVAPTFIAHEPLRAMADVVIWLGAVVLGSQLLGRLRLASRGAAALAALVASGVAVVLATSGIGGLPASPTPLPDVDLSARPRLAALDTFDRVTRPVAVRYSPLRVSSVADVESSLSLGVTPGLRREAQPVRVLHNGRFSLPAGRYRVLVQWDTRNPLPAPPGSTIALQVGRVGSPMRTWTVAPVANESWQEEFWLPVDTGFVGFRGSPEIERSIAKLSVEALDVVDVGTRTTTPQVLGAAEYGPIAVLFHDERMFPESAGFWTAGRRQARVTLACADGCARGVELRLHSGKRPNHLRLSTHGWAQDIDLTGEVEVRVVVPPPAAGGVTVLDLETTTGFVPIEVDPTVLDRRFLGVWVSPALPPEDPR